MEGEIGAKNEGGKREIRNGEWRVERSLKKKNREEKNTVP
jgi:hypothetical protein